MSDPGNKVGIVIGAFRSILLLSILMLNKQIFQSCLSFSALADQKYDFVPLHNSKLHGRTRVTNLAMVDRECFETVYFSSKIPLLLQKLIQV